MGSEEGRQKLTSVIVASLTPDYKDKEESNHCDDSSHNSMSEPVSPVPGVPAASSLRSVASSLQESG